MSATLPPQGKRESLRIVTSRRGGTYCFSCLCLPSVSLFLSLFFYELRRKLGDLGCVYFDCGKDLTGQSTRVRKGEKNSTKLYPRRVHVGFLNTDCLYVLETIRPQSGLSAQIQLGAL